MGVLFRQTAHQAHDPSVSGLYRLNLCYTLCPAGDDCPLKFLVAIPQAQQRLDDAEDSQDPFFLLFDDQLIALALTASLSSYVGRNPEELIERAITKFLLDGVDAGGRIQFEKLRVRV